VSLRIREKSLIVVTIRKNTPIRNLDTAPITLPDSKFDIMHTYTAFFYGQFLIKSKKIGPKFLSKNMRRSFQWVDIN